MFQSRFVKVDECGWWYLEIIQTDSGIQITSKEFQESLSVCGVQLKLAAQDHKEIHVQFEVTWQTLQKNGTFNYGEHTGFCRIYKFCSNVHG